MSMHKARHALCLIPPPTEPEIQAEQISEEKRPSDFTKFKTFMAFYRLKDNENAVLVSGLPEESFLPLQVTSTGTIKRKHLYQRNADFHFL